MEERRRHWRVLDLSVWRLILWSSLLLWAAVYACDSGFFGPSCEYSCHCETDFCNPDGTCDSEKCLYGWFGPACQYMDLATLGSVTTSSGEITEVTDGDDSTCVMSNDLKATTIAWSSNAYVITWIRIVTKNTSLGERTYADIWNSFNIQFRKFSDSKLLECRNRQQSVVNSRTFDIACNLDGAVAYMILTGEGIKSLCSVYISGECPLKFYSYNCRKPCSTNCTNEMCHHDKGHCYSCIPGTRGDYCEQVAPVLTVPPSVEAREGMNFTISCVIRMIPSPISVLWFKDNVPLSIANISTKYRDGTLAVPSLTVLNAVKTDTGSYTCKADNDVDTVSNTTSVNINYLPKVTVPSTDIDWSLGETGTISCSIDSNPGASDIVWRRHEIGAANDTAADVITEGRISGGKLTTPSLTIASLEPTDSGTYYCVVTNSLGTTTSDPVDLHIHYKPTNVIVTSSPTALLIGERFELTCSADAYPPVTSYTWYRGDQEVAGTATYAKTHATLSDYTEFRCSVTNPLNTTEATIKPNIQFVPQLTVPVTTITSDMKSPIVLTCGVEANPALTDFYWTKVGAGVVKSTINPTKYDGGTAGTTTLVIFNSETSDSGEYTCTAVNSVGTTISNYVTVNVTGETVTHKPNARVTVEKSKEVTLRCEARPSSYLTQVSWTKGGPRLITTDTSKYSGGNVTIPDLTIRRVTDSDSGNYACVAIDDQGQRSGTIIVLTSIIESPDKDSMNTGLILGIVLGNFGLLLTAVVIGIVIWRLTRKDQRIYDAPGPNRECESDSYAPFRYYSQPREFQVSPAQKSSADDGYFEPINIENDYAELEDFGDSDGYIRPNSLAEAGYTKFTQTCSSTDDGHAKVNETVNLSEHGRDMNLSNNEYLIPINVIYQTKTDLTSSSNEDENESENIKA